MTVTLEQKAQSLKGPFNVPKPDPVKRVFKRVLSAVQNEQWGKITSNEKALTGFVNRQGQTVVVALIDLDDVETVEKLCKDGQAKVLEILAGKDLWKHCLHTAIAMKASIKMIGAFQTCNDWEEKDARGRSALHVAIEAGRHRLVRLAIKKDSTLAKQVFISGSGNSVRRYNPFTHAIACGQNQCFEVLIKDKNTSFNFSNARVAGIGSILHLAIDNGHTDTLEYLFRKYTTQCKPLVDVKEQNTGRTALMLAAIKGNTKAIELLHTHKASFKERDHNKHNALHLAIKGDQKEAVHWLVRCEPTLMNEMLNHTAPGGLVSNEDPKRIKLLLKGLRKQGKKVSKPNYDLYPPENLVFKGGGPKGVAYLAALKMLEDRGKINNVRRIAGSSAGAIFAVGVAFNYTSDQLLTLLRDKQKTNFESFLDLPEGFNRKKLLNATRKGKYFKVLWNVYSGYRKQGYLPHSAIRKLLKTTGLCEGKVFREWIEMRIWQQCGDKHCTFGEMKTKYSKNNFKDLTVYTINLAKNQKITRISSEDPKWKDVVVASAVQASMSIPGVFKPCTLRVKRNEQVAEDKSFGQFVDGGLRYNMPLEAFDFKKYTTNDCLPEERLMPTKNMKTLAFSLYTKKSVSGTDTTPTSAFGLIKAVVGAWSHSETALRSIFDPKYKNRIISINNSEVKLLDFDLTTEQENRLLKAGERATTYFLQHGEANDLRDKAPSHKK